MDYAAMTKTPTRKRRRTRLVRVDQETIDFMLKHERPHRPLPAEFPESIDRLRPGFRAYIASINASIKRSDDRDADILRQYRAKGYAEIELVAEELDDEEDDGSAEKEESVAVADGAPMPAKKK